MAGRSGGIRRTGVPTMAQIMTAFTDAQLQDIQGFGIAGFRKDTQESLFVRINTRDGGKTLIPWLVPQIANAWEVGEFNEVFSEVRRRIGREPLKATWTAAMVSAAGFNALGVTLGDLPAGDGTLAFEAGMAARAVQIADTQAADLPQRCRLPFRPDANHVQLALV